MLDQILQIFIYETSSQSAQYRQVQCPLPGFHIQAYQSRLTTNFRPSRVQTYYYRQLWFYKIFISQNSTETRHPLCDIQLIISNSVYGNIRQYKFMGPFNSFFEGPRWQSGNTLASHLCGRGSIPVMAVSGKARSCLPLVGSLQ